MDNTYPKNKIELPTVGRIVLYYHPDAPAPWPAMVVAVPDDGRPLLTHLRVFSLEPSVLVHKDVPHMSVAAEHGEVYWDWMPYQKSQAAKTEALQAELDKRVG